MDDGFTDPGHVLDFDDRNDIHNPFADIHIKAVDSVESPRYLETELNRFILEMTLRYGNEMSFRYGKFIHGTKDDNYFPHVSIKFMEYVGSNVRDIVKKDRKMTEYMAEFSNFHVFHSVEIEYRSLKTECKVQRLPYTNAVSMITYWFEIKNGNLP